jgi:hypothetical protein
VSASSSCNPYCTYTTSQFWNATLAFSGSLSRLRMSSIASCPKSVGDRPPRKKRVDLVFDNDAPIITSLESHKYADGTASIFYSGFNYYASSFLQVGTQIPSRSFDDRNQKREEIAARQLDYRCSKPSILLSFVVL